jgi:hypothetical protein
MTADVNQDRRVTGVIQGTILPVLSDGSRLFWALPSPVHEELGYGPLCPTGYKVMRWFPHLLFTARSRIASCRLCRDLPSSRPRKPPAVLAAVKAWPIEAGTCGAGGATASLDCSCARRFGGFEVGTKKRLGRTKKLIKASAPRRVGPKPPRGPPAGVCLTAGSLPLDSGPHTRMTAHIPVDSI